MGLGMLQVAGRTDKEHFLHSAGPEQDLGHLWNGKVAPYCPHLVLQNLILVAQVQMVEVGGDQAVEVLV